MTDLRPTSSDQPRASDPRRSAHKAALGFGCASLYGLPTKRDRRAVLESAYDCGIRHFDVAPIYGLGVAETELGEFIGSRTDIVVATKFGLKLTIAGRLASLAQSPMRRVLQRSPGLMAKARNPKDPHGTGLPGRLLYADRAYSVADARDALAESLRTLRVEYLDYFLLHEPSGASTGDYRGLIDYLETERRNGRIGHWGPAGDLSQMDSNLADLSGEATVHQCPYDLIGGHRGPQPKPGRVTITFGFISRPLPRIRAILQHQPDFRQRCSELLDADLGDQRNLIRLVVRNALIHNEFGTVLVSSTKIANLEMLVEAAGTHLRNEVEVSSMIRRKCSQAPVS